MRAAIITLTHVQNYGNRLQNFALQVTLEKLGITVETIFNDVYGTKTRILKDFKRIIKRFIPGKYTCIERRIDCFNKFNRKYIKKSRFVADAGMINAIVNDEYDFFLAGSDQIWNPNYNYSPYFFLQFADNSKRNTYAASFGVSYIEEDKEPVYREWLSSIKNISVREDEAVSIVNALTGKKAVQVLDPTLLLSCEEWKQIEHKPDNVSKEARFFVVYFLGDIPEIVLDYIADAEAKNMKAIYVDGDVVPLEKIYDKKSHSYGPQEFLWLISHCEFVLTDSFHGTVFSILNKKKFYVFDRTTDVGSNKMESRLLSLLRQLGLKDKFCPRKIDFDKDFDFETVEKIIEIEKKDSIQYLRSIIEYYSLQEK